jgi:4-amino-4-deoxy-L-arabinose transferase-like glycosyltransferase
LLIHLLLGNRYGYFRDELSFLDCGRHLDWGYVDHAPLIGVVARFALFLGGSLPALRVFPAAAGAALVALTGLIAWRLGGGRFAQGLAGLAVIVMPIYLGMDSILTMNAFEPLFWMGSAYLLIRIIQTRQPRLWIPFGILAGLGLMNRDSTAFFLLAVGVGLLLSPERRELRKPGPWLAFALALLIFLPNLWWQFRHDFPTLEDLRNVARIGKNVVLGPAAFLGQQVLIIHPVLLPVWLTGLAYLVIARRG